jgi:hypothetical protein
LACVHNRHDSRSVSAARSASRLRCPLFDVFPPTFFFPSHLCRVTPAQLMLTSHSVEGIVEWDVLLTFRLHRLRSRPRSHVTSLAATRRTPLPSYPPGGSNTLHSLNHVASLSLLRDRMQLKPCFCPLSSSAGAVLSQPFTPNVSNSSNALIFQMLLFGGKRACVRGRAEAGVAVERMGRLLGQSMPRWGLRGSSGSRFQKKHSSGISIAAGSRSGPDVARRVFLPFALGCHATTLLSCSCSFESLIDKRREIGLLHCFFR